MSFLSDPPPEPDSDFELPESLPDEELPEPSFGLSEPDEPSPDEPFDPLAEAPAATVLGPLRLSVR